MFLEWARNTSILVPTRKDLSQGFIIGLTLPLYLALEHLITVGYTFSRPIEVSPQVPGSSEASGGAHIDRVRSNLTIFALEAFISRSPLYSRRVPVQSSRGGAQFCRGSKGSSSHSSYQSLAYTGRYNCGEIGHLSRECPKHELVIYTLPVFVTPHTRVVKSSHPGHYLGFMAPPGKGGSPSIAGGSSSTQVGVKHDPLYAYTGRPRA
ncbi:hypothetical protein KY284_026661 [Solanum tuberosum]|nr:hypothetical protein KY284_026661 [Solanum tuberosum]